VAAAEFNVADQDGRIEIRDGGKLVFGWQYDLIKKPLGGDEFAASAFVHPLCTPSGFNLTRIQPGDHLHHFGVWWPWKFLMVKGEKFNTWEMQAGQGRHVGVSARIKSQAADEVVIEAQNRSEIKAKGKDYLPVTVEKCQLRFARLGDDAYVLDITIDELPTKGIDVEVVKYRYSGFSWRGIKAWNKENSHMTTDSGHNRDNANGEETRWFAVAGATESGKATMLMMSAAAKNGGAPERARVWNSKTMDGTPFANFNPVVKTSFPMKAGQKEVASRQYRLIVADRAIDPAEAEKLWKAWK